MLSRLFPNSSRRKKQDKLDDIMYLFMCEFGWSWEQFNSTPIPILMRLLKTHIKKQKQKNKKGKKK